MSEILRSNPTINGQPATAASGGIVGGWYPVPPSGTQSFTAPGETTWTPPGGVAELVIELWGGGAAGALCIAGTTGATGGGGGGYAKATLGAGLFTPGAELTITVGAGGLATDVNVDGKDSLLVCEGVTVVTGGGGLDTSGGTGAVGVHAGISGGSTDAGDAGKSSVTAAGGDGGSGGGTGGGAGGAGGKSDSAGSAGVAPGGGGGGAGNNVNAPHYGGNGAAGKVTITWGGG